MPFKSKAQRGFMYSQHPKLAKEFEAATPEGAKLPEHVKKMAYGGETNPKKETISAMENNPTAGFAEGGEVKDEKPSDYGTLAGFRELLRKAHAQAVDESTGTAKAPNMAAGGAVPPLGQVMTNLNATPATNYDFYKDISSEDRNKLYQQLQQQKQGGGQAAISGLAGLGDAISNSYGGQKTNFQQNVGNMANQNMEGRLGAFDTQRTQRMQDLQGNQEAMMNDPNSPLSQSLRDAAQKSGMKVGSLMPASVLMKLIPAFGDLGIKQTQMAIQSGAAAENARHNKAEESRQETDVALQAQKEAREAADRENARKLAAADTLSHQGPMQRLTNILPITRSPENQILRDVAKGNPAPANHGVPDLGSTFNGGKVLSVKRVK